MSCIHRPTEETTLVHHNARKTGRRSGAQIEVTGRASVVTEYLRNQCLRDRESVLYDGLGMK